MIADELALSNKIQINNSQLNSDMANALETNGVKHLLVKNSDDGDWETFTKELSILKSLCKLELFECSAIVFKNIAQYCSHLKVVNALSIKSKSLDLENLKNLSNLKQLQISGMANITLESDLSFLLGFSQLTHLVSIIIIN